MRVLYYAHDPMCSWCWAFRPGWRRIREALPGDVEVRTLLGGLAPDSDQPMPAPMQQYLQQTWQRIAQVVPGTRFNFDFWRECHPRRSTWPACRAVLAAQALDPALAEPMTAAIQEAYYLHARNPSEQATLVAIAGELGLDENAFRERLQAPEIDAELARQIASVHALGVEGFPALVLEQDGQRRALRIDYNDPTLVLGELAA